MIGNHITNVTPIEHTCRNGTSFKCERADLKGGVTVTQAWGDANPEKRMADFAEFGAWHAHWIHEHLNGFQGYDCVRYVFTEEDINVGG